MLLIEIDWTALTSPTPYDAIHRCAWPGRSSAGRRGCGGGSILFPSAPQELYGARFFRGRNTGSTRSSACDLQSRVPPAIDPGTPDRVPLPDRLEPLQGLRPPAFSPFYRTPEECSEPQL